MPSGEDTLTTHQRTNVSVKMSAHDLGVEKARIANQTSLLPDQVTSSSLKRASRCCTARVLEANYLARIMQSSRASAARPGVQSTEYRVIVPPALAQGQSKKGGKDGAGGTSYMDQLTIELQTVLKVAVLGPIFTCSMYCAKV